MIGYAEKALCWREGGSQPISLAWQVLVAQGVRVAHASLDDVNTLFETSGRLWPANRQVSIHPLTQFSTGGKVSLTVGRHPALHSDPANSSMEESSFEMSLAERSARSSRNGSGA